MRSGDLARFGLLRSRMWSAVSIHSAANGRRGSTIWIATLRPSARRKRRMLLKSQSGANTQIVIDRATHAIVLPRTVSVSRALAFEAWTRPEHVTCWWDPAGHPLAKCEI